MPGLCQILAVAALAAAVGCSNDPEAGPLPVDEYAAVVCAVDNSADLPFTWGEAAAAWREHRDRMESVIPPTELAPWHDATLWATKLALDHAEEQAADGAFNPFDLLGVGLMVAGTITEAERAVSEETVAVLAAHGCDTDAWGEDPP